MNTVLRPDDPAPLVSDEEVVRRVLAGDTSAFEILMRRHNERVYRAIRSRIRREADVEEVMQRTYLSVFTALHQFEGRARFSTWLTRIALNESYRWLRPAGPELVLVDEAPREAAMDTTHADPEHQAQRAQWVALLQAAVDELPEGLSAVYVLREVEGMSSQEVAEALDLSSEAVRVRLHRARQQLRLRLLEVVGPVASQAYPFHRPRCDRVVDAVFTAIKSIST